VERCITREKISFLTDESAFTMDYSAPQDVDPASRSYSVLRNRFDQWLMGKAEEAGAQSVPGIRVDEVITENGKAVGVRAGDEELMADVIILADGVNSILGEKLGMVREVTPHNCAVGVKEVIELGAKEIEARFGLEGKTGAAWLFAGMPSAGLMGGGFLYTNESTVSLGVVFGLHSIAAAGKSVPQMLEDFKSHPAVRPLVEGGTLAEYSAHVVPEGGLRMLPKLVGDGVILAGDAAGFCLNVGYTVRGMDLAIASGEAAAKAVIAAKARGDCSAAGLSEYAELINKSFIMKDFQLYKKAPNFLDNPRMFTTYPAMVTDMMKDIFTVNGPSKGVLKKMLPHMRAAGLINLAKDGLNGMRAL
jgi:electron transfer flavoprotein-quinone oxidoreductase